MGFKKNARKAAKTGANRETMFYYYTEKVEDLAEGQGSGMRLCPFPNTPLGSDKKGAWVVWDDGQPPTYFQGNEEEIGGQVIVKKALEAGIITDDMGSEELLSNLTEVLKQCGFDEPTQGQQAEVRMKMTLRDDADEPMWRKGK